MDDQSKYYQDILVYMDDGVMALDMSGRIAMFNAAASRITGLCADDVVGKPFGMVFMMDMAENDDFVQVVLDAVEQKDVVHNQIVPFTRSDGTKFHLAVKATYLQDQSRERSSNGIIVVFSDISEIMRLREEENRLHQKLRNAFLDLETSNRDLNRSLTGKRIGRIILIASIVLLLALGAWFGYRKAGHRASGGPAASAPSASAEGIPAEKIVEVRTGPITSKVTLAGVVQPLRIINIVCPFDTTVVEKNFSYGQYVNEGDVLLKLGTADLLVAYRDARADYMAKLQEFETVKGWDSSHEVAQAKRALIKAKSSVENAKAKLADADLLMGKGIISRQEYDSLDEQYRNSLMEEKTAEEALAATLKKGGKVQADIAGLNLANAQAKLEELEAQLSRGTVRAPAAGVVLLPAAENDEAAKPLENGEKVARNAILLAIGNMDGITVKASLDEADLAQVRLGQKAVVTGDGFPGLALEGTLAEIAPQASKSQASGGGRGAAFDVTARVPRLDAAEQAQVRLGMSANVAVTIAEKPEALLLPFTAIRVFRGSRYVRRVDPKTGAAAEVMVRTGATTSDSVEILSGIGKGDRVVLY
ncbi:MAG: HlyD family efflux transporter periplasmic adaptor subunit [Thermodesulfobacteriota bacterium]